LGVCNIKYSAFRLKSLLTTPLKIKILENLRQPKAVNELIKSMNVSRDTIKPHIRYLSNLHLIKKESDCYKLTDIGEVLLDKLNEVEDLVELIEKRGEFFATHDLAYLPDDLIKDIHLLKNCEVHAKEDPFQIRMDWFEVARNSRWLKCVVSVLYPELLRIYPILAEGKEYVKVIFTKNVMERALTLYPDLTKKCMEMGEFYQCEKVTEWFWVSNRQLTLFLPKGQMPDPINVLICNCKEGIEWGTRLFEHYLKRSVRIEEL